jgi:hypothetical protein
LDCVGHVGRWDWDDVVIIEFEVCEKGHGE